MNFESLESRNEMVITNKECKISNLSKGVIFLELKIYNHCKILAVIVI